jgi:D-alanyl-D-alanine carboxypeptidase
MDSNELQKLAERSRSMRESGIALLIASGILGLCILLPQSFGTRGKTTAPVATVSTPDAFERVSIEATAAIVYDLATQKILYAQNADAQLPLASLTKLLTVYAAFTQLPSTTSITIPTEVTKLDMPRAFNAGQIFSLSDLARLTLTASLNDGAAAIASATAAEENKTQGAMLASAASALGLSQTYAVNASGLDVTTVLSGGYGSAYDVARLAGALVAQSPEVALATTETSTRAVSEGGTVFVVKNTDPMVNSFPRLLLSKTGYTDLAGGNLALVFDVGLGHPIAVIVLGSSKNERFTDGSRLVAATLAHFAGIASL